MEFPSSTFPSLLKCHDRETKQLKEIKYRQTNIFPSTKFYWKWQKFQTRNQQASAKQFCCARGNFFFFPPSHSSLFFSGTQRITITKFLENLIFSLYKLKHLKVSSLQVSALIKLLMPVFIFTLLISDLEEMKMFKFWNFACSESFRFLISSNRRNASRWVSSRSRQARGGWFFKCKGDKTACEIAIIISAINYFTANGSSSSKV